MKTLYEETPPATKPGWSRHIVQNGVQVYEPSAGQLAVVNVGHTSYTPEQAEELVSAISAAAAVARGYNERAAANGTG